MQQITHDNSNLPIELYTKPLALIGFSGLDVVNNAIHKSIWEAFSNARRIENAPVLYKLIGNAHEFPVIKPKRNSYDWYIPKGILKKNWMNKYLNEIPAVMVIFYDLDWDDGLWNEKMIECASRVQSIRAALEGRNTRIVVVLIQNTVPLPHGDDVLATERAVSLCASCELNATSLFVLPHGDHLLGYVTRLEMAFFEFAQNYYHGEIKNVRLHKEHLNKNTHQYLLVRHQFKLGFLNELKQDKHTALKHYSHAYNNLLEIRIVDTNALEIRTIAGFINYKLCRLMFNLNLPRDAITQFKTHIDRFKNRIGFQELSFEHHAWLSKQFSVFGDIFDEAVKLGLPAVQTQHPGIYYQQAAQFAIIRKHTCRELCANVTAYPQPDPLDGSNYMEFYGQRPWRPGKLTAEPPDPHLETNGIKALQFLETQVAHSSIIVALFGLAISQYKIYRCPRTRRHLVLQMADEYYNAHDYGKALTLLTHMLWDFRNENWWLLLTDILKKALRCAFLTANIQDFVLLSLEILGKSSKLLDDDRQFIYANLCRVVEKQIPIGESGLPPDRLQNALLQWDAIFKKPSPLSFSLDLTNIPCCIEVKARFLQRQYQVDEKVTVELYVRCTSSFVMNFTKISITINSPTTSTELPVDQQHFESNGIKRFRIEFLPDPNDLNQELQIACINLTIGGKPGICLFALKFSNLNNSNSTTRELLHFKYCSDKIDFVNIDSNPIAAIIPRYSRLSVKLEHSAPALLGEWFPIKITITNDEDHNIKDVVVQIKSLDDESLIHTEFSTVIDGAPQKLPLILPTTKQLRCTNRTTTIFFIRAHKIIEHHIEIKISYILDCGKPVISIKTENLAVSIVKPFELETKFLSKLMLEIDRFFVGEEIGIMPILRCLSPWPIIIENAHLEFINPFNKTIENPTKNRLNFMKLHNKEIGTEIYLGVCNKIVDHNATVGQYLVKWKREGGASATSQLTIMGHPCEWMPLALSITIPAHGLVRTPLLVKYHFYNRSHQLLQLDVCMEASEAFMFAGFKQFSISILPESVKTIQYNLYPLIAGSVALPKFVLTLPENSTEGPALRQEQLRFLIDRSLPTHLYVMPQVKGDPKISDAVKARKLEIST